MAVNFSSRNPIFLRQFGTPCQLIASPPYDFKGIYYAPNSNQAVTLSPQRTLAISSNKPSLWVDLADFPGGVSQDAVIVIDPDGLSIGPLTRKVFDKQEDGMNGCFLILKI